MAESLIRCFYRFLHLLFLPYFPFCSARSCAPVPSPLSHSSSLSPSLPSPSAPLSPAAFIHPCHFVYSFLLCSCASDRAAGSVPAPILPFTLPCTLTVHFFFLFTGFFPPLPFFRFARNLNFRGHPPAILTAYFSHFTSHCIFLSASLTSSSTSTMVLLLLLGPPPPCSIPPFTLTDGSIDSLSDDIAQGRPGGRKTSLTSPEYLCVQYFDVCACASVRVRVCI